MNVKISLNNSKLGAAIPSVNLPPVITCRKNAPCASGCYDLKGNWRYANVKQSLANNLKLYQENPIQYFQDIIDFLNNQDVTYKFFRYHSAGDIIDYIYLKGMVSVARTCPNVKFLAFTKKFELVNDYLQYEEYLPENLKIVFSAWDKDFEVINPHNLPVTYIKFCKSKGHMTPDIPEFSIPCVGSCKVCKACWSLQLNQSVYFKQH